jgi:hypothetical protein
MVVNVEGRINHERKVLMKRFRDYLPRENKEIVSGKRKLSAPSMLLLLLFVKKTFNDERNAFFRSLYNLCQFKILYVR